MNAEILTARFDGAQWRCPVADCNSALADFKTDANKSPFLLLRKGLVFVERRRIWQRPKNELKDYQGQRSHARMRRTLMKRKTGSELELAKEQFPNKRQTFDADQVNDEPLVIQCLNADCQRLCYIPSLRGRDTGAGS